MIHPRIRSMAGAAVAGGVALLCAGWPYQLGLLSAAVAGIAGGWLVARRRGEA